MKLHPCPTSLRINRKRWLRGAAGPYAGSEYRALRPGETRIRRCCLGHLSKKAGMPEELLRRWGRPNSAFPIRTLVTQKGTETAFARNAMLVNDTLVLTDSDREWRLIELFAKNGIKLSFVG